LPHPGEPHHFWSQAQCHFFIALWISRKRGGPRNRYGFPKDRLGRERIVGINSPLEGRNRGDDGHPNTEELPILEGSLTNGALGRDVTAPFLISPLPGKALRFAISCERKSVGGPPRKKGTPGHFQLVQ